MACALPDAQMSAQERACCRMMKNDCGDMSMGGDSSHGCCRKVSYTADLNAVQAERVTFHPAVFVAAWAVTARLIYPPSSVHVWAPLPEDSPPESPPVSITVLRI